MNHICPPPEYTSVFIPQLISGGEGGKTGIAKIEKLILIHPLNSQTVQCTNALVLIFISYTLDSIFYMKLNHPV